MKSTVLLKSVPIIVVFVMLKFCEHGPPDQASSIIFSYQAMAYLEATATIYHDEQVANKNLFGEEDSAEFIHDLYFSCFILATH